MKKLIKLTLVVALVLGSSSLFAQKLGRINLEEIITLMPEYKEMMTNMEAYSKDLRDNLETIQVELNTKYNDFQKNKATYSEVTRQLKEKELTDLQNRLQEFYQSAQEDLQKKEKELTDPIVAKAQEAVKNAAERANMPYINQRWLGGMLTNFKTIRSRIERLKAIETMSEDGTFDVLPKKEVIQLKKEWEKLEKNLGGIKNMTRIPDAIFVVDPKKEKICVQEAHALGITLIGIGDTNCDPEELDYIIPGNDDAIRAVKLITSKMADAVIEANQGEEVYTEEAAAQGEASDIEEVAAAEEA